VNLCVASPKATGQWKLLDRPSVLVGPVRTRTHDWTMRVIIWSMTYYKSSRFWPGPTKTDGRSSAFHTPCCTLPIVWETKLGYLLASDVNMNTFFVVVEFLGIVPTRAMVWRNIKESTSTCSLRTCSRAVSGRLPVFGTGMCDLLGEK
jgi:hypothetical protein